MKIVILEGCNVNPGDLSWEGFAQLGDLTVLEKTEDHEVAERIGDAELIITNKCRITGEVMDACPNLQYIGVIATGYNVIDVEGAKARGITVTNIPTYGTRAVAQHAIALLLEITCGVGHHSQAVHEGRWEKSDWCFWDFPLMELADKTMGIIGFGRIGQTTGQIARALGMEVLAFDEHPCDAGREIARYVALDELLAASHVVSLHCPLFPATQGIINRKTIAKMRDGAILINTSRGGLIVEADLTEALNGGKLAAAGLDVVSEEPIRSDNPLLKAKNCFITPHIAWASIESRRRLVDIAVDNLRQYLAGSPVNVVNQ